MKSMSAVICLAWGQRSRRRLSSFVRRVFGVVVAVGQGLGVVWQEQGLRFHLFVVAIAVRRRS